MKKKVLVIGLDGATFSVIDSLVREERLPNLSRLMREGASGILKSTTPPLTGPAWLSLATGMKPEKTGVYDFVVIRGGGYRLRGVTSREYFGRSLWDYFEQYRKEGRYSKLSNAYASLRDKWFYDGGSRCLSK